MLATIGVYGFTAETFLEALRRRGRAADPRRAPAPRGARSRVRLGELQAPPDRPRRGRDRLPAPPGARAHHRPAPAPVPRGRPAGRRQALARRARSGVPRALHAARSSTARDLDAVVAALPDAGAGALLCVERDPEACHRSLVAERIATSYGVRSRTCARTKEASGRGQSRWNRKKFEDEARRMAIRVEADERDDRRRRHRC